MENTELQTIKKEMIKSIEGNQFVTFTIEDEEFGIDILKVQEIIGYIKPTHVPNSPKFMRGVINLRGVIIPVMDLREKFSLPEKEYDKFTVIMVVQVQSKTVGLIVDAVSDVITINEKDIQDVPEFTKFHTEYLNGMGKVGDKLVILLDIDKVLSADEYKEIVHSS